MCAGTGKGGDLQTNGSTVVADKYISDARTGEKNYTGTLADAFSSLGRPGSPGCGFEQPLDLHSRVVLLLTEQEAVRAPASRETFLAPEGRVSAAALVSEEVLLSVPHRMVYARL